MPSAECRQGTQTVLPVHRTVSSAPRWNCGVRMSWSWDVLRAVLFQKAAVDKISAVFHWPPVARSRHSGKAWEQEAAVEKQLSYIPTVRGSSLQQGCSKGRPGGRQSGTPSTAFVQHPTGAHRGQPGAAAGPPGCSRWASFGGNSRVSLGCPALRLHCVKAADGEECSVRPRSPWLCVSAITTLRNALDKEPGFHKAFIYKYLQAFSPPRFKNRNNSTAIKPWVKCFGCFL